MRENWKWIALGTAALLIGFWGYRWLKSEKDTDLFHAYFEPYPVPLSAPLGEDLMHWLGGVSQYNQGNFEQARQEFQLARRERSMPSFVVDFYLGQSFLATQVPDSAVGCFSRVLQQQSGIQSLARWYLGLAYLAEGNNPKASYHFQILFEEGGFRSRDAGIILDKLVE